MGSIKLTVLTINSDHGVAGTVLTITAANAQTVTGTMAYDKKDSTIGIY